SGQYQPAAADRHFGHFRIRPLGAEPPAGSRQPTAGALTGSDDRHLQYRWSAGDPGVRCLFGQKSVSPERYAQFQMSGEGLDMGPISIDQLSESLGWYGKMPSSGDFVHRR